MPVAINNISIGGSFAAEIPVFPACIVRPLLSTSAVIESLQGCIIIGIESHFLLPQKKLRVILEQ